MLYARTMELIYPRSRSATVKRKHASDGETASWRYDGLKRDMVDRLRNALSQTQSAASSRFRCVGRIDAAVMNGNLRSAECRTYGSYGKCSGPSLRAPAPAVRKRLHFEHAPTRLVRRGSKFRAKPKSPPSDLRECQGRERRRKGRFSVSDCRLRHLLGPYRR